VTNTGNAYFSNVRPEAFIVPVYLCRGTHIHAMISAIGAERSYAQTKGNTASNFSFQGASLGQQIETVPFLAATRTEPGKRLTNIYIYIYIYDYGSFATAFSFELLVQQDLRAW
jgi:hypothetical protein